ncbi:hypothetical protein EYV94_20690 [Puteibacter caeruleilacunae]|nr:hypothetical protein EYV94_20690 [Puteibacter caeruleilacunae]
MYNVPVSILIYSLRNRKVNQVKLYLVMKYWASGNIRLTDEVVDDICSTLDWCTKTFKTHLKWLLHKKWVSYNNKTKSLHIKGYKRIAKKWHCEENKGIICSDNDLINFRPFAYAGVISWVRLRKYYKDRGSKRLNGGFNLNSHLENLYDVPNRYLAKILKLHYSTISKYRTEADDTGYIEVKHNFRKRRFTSDHLPMMKKILSEIEDRLFSYKGFVYEQLPSTIDSHMCVTRKRLFKKWKPETGGRLRLETGERRPAAPGEKRPENGDRLRLEKGFASMKVGDLKTRAKTPFSVCKS